ncbi:MAG: hypothetical protein LBP39_02485, partial [Rickettsiales bacterium]|nr:hypothetical protein [Rickettsiales bacterium]
MSPVVTIQVKTFGCRLNSYESKIIEKILRGISDAPPFAGRDIIVFNSCAVTAAA